MDSSDREQIIDDLGREVAGQLHPDQTVRRDCAFCGRERVPADDNHAPDCFFWAIWVERDLPW